jgi:transcriptional regulator with XRE-family HTH domain
MSAHERLKAARIAAGFKAAADAAECNNWASSTYYGHENGSRGLTADAAQLYATAFGCSPGWLMFGGTSPLTEALVRRIIREELHAALQFAFGAR